MDESRGTTPNGHSSPNSNSQTNRAHSHYDYSDDEHDDDDHEDSPVELNDYEMDPINSGAGTPRRVNHRGMPLDTVGQARNFLGNSKSLKRESKTVKGVVYAIIDDEIMLPEDSKGEAKIDVDGNLLGGREYKLSTFTSPMRTTSPDRRFMLSIDAARAAGFRDSLYFFRRNPLVHKLSCSQAEKDRLIDLGKLSPNLKSRAVTMVSARNCFKVMGATFVQDGKYINDDYYEEKSAAAGHVAGEPAWIETYDPEKDSGTLASAKGLAPIGITGSGLNTLLGHSGKPRSSQSDILRAGSLARAEGINLPVGKTFSGFGGAGMQPFGKVIEVGAKKVRPPAIFTGVNWMSEYAKNVQLANKELAELRRGRLMGVRLSLGIEDRPEDLWIEKEDDVDEGAYASSSYTNGGADASGSLAVASTSANAAGSPLPFLPTTRTKRRFYNPILGVNDPETNTPRVPSSTQPTRATIDRVATTPSLFESAPQFDLEEARSMENKRRRTLEKAASKIGIASVEIVVEEESNYRPYLTPGSWDFQAG